MLEELYTATELEKSLKLGRHTILKLAAEGKLPCIRLNSRVVRFHLPDVMAAIEKLAAEQVASVSAQSA